MPARSLHSEGRPFDIRRQCSCTSGGARASLPGMLAGRTQVNASPGLHAARGSLGFLSFGLMLAAAVARLAVNHVGDWAPSLAGERQVHQLGGPLAGRDRAVAAAVLQRLGIQGTPREVYRAAPDQLDVLLDLEVLHINP